MLSFRSLFFDRFFDDSNYPSACNRQPCKVYYSVNESMLKEIGKLISDQYVVRGNIFNFFVVICDRNLFSEGEIFQYYVTLIAVVGFGVPKNREKVPYGKRKDVREVAISVGENF